MRKMKGRVLSPLLLDCMLWCHLAAASTTSVLSLGMQNPVATLMYLTGNMQLLGPLISLLIETRPYCQSPLRSKPMLLVALVYILVAFGSILSPRQFVYKPLALFDFPQSFRWQLGVQTAISTLAYAAAIRVTRRML